MTRVCSVASCTRPVEKREWCGMHYQRWRKNGDPLKVKRFRVNGLLEERFRAKLKEMPDGCVEWQGARIPWGYGKIGTDKGKRLLSTHRLAWELANGPIPEGLCVLHRCDNPPCCNPDHLFLGTVKDNTEDMLAKGRMPTGERHGGSTVPDALVAEAIQLKNLGFSPKEVQEWLGTKGYHASRSGIEHWGQKSRRGQGTFAGVSA